MTMLVKRMTSKFSKSVLGEEDHVTYDGYMEPAEFAVHTINRVFYVLSHALQLQWLH